MAIAVQATCTECESHIPQGHGITGGETALCDWCAGIALSNNASAWLIAPGSEPRQRTLLPGYNIALQPGATSTATHPPVDISDDDTGNWHWDITPHSGWAVALRRRDTDDNLDTWAAPHLGGHTRPPCPLWFITTPTARHRWYDLTVVAPAGSLAQAREHLA